MKRIAIYFSILLSVFLEIGILNRFFASLYLSVVPTIVLLAFLSMTFKQMLVIGAIAGLIIDMAALSRSIFTTVILLAEILLISFAGKKYFDFSSNIVSAVGCVVISVVVVFLRLLFSGVLSFSIRLLPIFSFNIVLSLLIFILWKYIIKFSYDKTV